MRKKDLKKRKNKLPYSNGNKIRPSNKAHSRQRTERPTLSNQVYVSRFQSGDKINPINILNEEDRKKRLDKLCDDYGIEKLYLRH